MLQQDKPDDFVIATGEQHSVREFADLAFKNNGITIEWLGSGIEEVGIDTKTNKVIVSINPKFFRPTEVASLCGDSTKAKTILGWNPLKTNFNELVSIMAESDKKKVETDKIYG